MHGLWQYLLPMVRSEKLHCMQIYSAQCHTHRKGPVNVNYTRNLDVDRRVSISILWIRKQAQRYLCALLRTIYYHVIEPGQALTFRRAKQNEERKRELNTLRNSLALLRAFLKVISLAKMTLCCSVRGSYFTSHKPLLALADCSGQFRIGVGGEFTSPAHTSQSSGPSLASALAKPPAQSFPVTEDEAGLARKRKVGNVAKNALGSA